MSICY